ncbi:MAG: YiiG family protein [Kluyvera sp.]|uniref:YiiG family protein n=1 Tax=Kluyvera sp. TaxID=1538228 RepID=UPI003A88B6D5
MKRNLLSVLIGCSLLLSLSACDDKKPAEDKTASQQAEQSQVQPASSTESRDEIAQGDTEQTKMSVYIECYNEVDADIYRAVDGYADWVEDMENGPTGTEEDADDGISAVTANVAECKARIAKVASLKPALEPIDKLAVSYINSSVVMANIINEMNKYYEQQDYKDDNFVKAKALHTQFMAAFSEFKPASDAYADAIHEINDRRQAEQLKNIEAKEGKSYDYYALSIMLTSKKLNRILESEKFDTDSAMKEVQALSDQITQLGTKKEEAEKGPRMRLLRMPTFIEAAEKYQLAVKKRIRHVRDNVPYTGDMEGAPQMVDGRYENVMAMYNLMVNWFNAMYD